MAGQQLLVVGAGWLGGPLAETLCRQGARVWTLQRSAGNAPRSGITAIAGDVRDGTNAPWCTQLPPQLDAVIVCVAPGRQAGDGYAETYPVAARGGVAIAKARGARTILYTSSTGVYGRTDGGISRETDPIVPKDPRQQALFDAEQRVLTDGITDPPSLTRIVLRVAGLYGPGRDPAARYRAAATTDPAGAEASWTNLAWRDDVISAIAHLITHPFAPGSTHCFNCADGTPMGMAEIARALGATVEAPPSARSHAGRSNQRIVVEALRATGWRPSQPTVLHGLAALGHAIHWPPDAVGPAAPYGPNTPAVRHFLRQLAGLGTSARADVVSRHASTCTTREWHMAETVLGTTIERAGRSDAQQAIAGPLLQLMRRSDAPADTRADDAALDQLDPIAEPALAALLVLIVADLLPAEVAERLYAPFASVIPWPRADQPPA